jgi:hypothetical protein
MAWWDIWEQPFSGAKKEDSGNNGTNINDKTTNVKRLKEDKFCVFLFRFCLVVGPFFFTLSSSLEKKLSPKI